MVWNGEKPTSLKVKKSSLVWQSLELHESESTIKVTGSSLAIINDPYMSLRNRFVFNMPD